MTSPYPTKKTLWLKWIAIACSAAPLFATQMVRKDHWEGRTQQGEWITLSQALQKALNAFAKKANNSTADEVLAALKPPVGGVRGLKAKRNTGTNEFQYYLMMEPPTLLSQCHDTQVRKRTVGGA